MGITPYWDIVTGLGFTVKSESDLLWLFENGLPTGSVNHLREKGLTSAEVSTLVVSPRTLRQRQSKEVKNLTQRETERLLRIARILSLAEYVFGNIEKTLNWLRASNSRLNDRTALSLLQTEVGGRLVEKMLWQIDEGVYT
jgi:putative toxin-antitoxin system antitoxin component (TIGR02293 family)